MAILVVARSWQPWTRAFILEHHVRFLSAFRDTTHDNCSRYMQALRFWQGTPCILDHTSMFLTVLIVPQVWLHVSPACSHCFKHLSW